MSQVHMGKLLLRNVIRHTDAHNKIQEESEMWKLRDLEKQCSSTYVPKNRGQMHCDRYLDDSEGSVRGRFGDKLSERDEKEAKYWTRKLYDFEANDPDRWGHSGFKELYPEEFQSDGEKECSDSKHRRKRRKMTLDADTKKNSKKSSKKKKRKKEKKRRRTVDSSSESCSDAEDSVRRKQRRKTGKNKRKKKEHKGKERTEDSSSEDSRSKTRTKTNRKREKLETDTLTEPQRKKRKNWKVGKDERSEQSSDS